MAAGGALKRRSLETERRWRAGPVRIGLEELRLGFDEESADTPPQGCEVRRREPALSAPEQLQTMHMQYER